MTLVDTSAWIHQLRPDGDAVVRQRVEALLRAGQARWCAMITLELWIGARGEHEKKILRAYERAIPDLALTTDVWHEAYELARKARASGLTCPAADVVIAACAKQYHCPLETSDQHLVELMKL